MRITTLASAAGILLAATIGSVSAADQFTTLNGVKQFGALNGVKAVPMSPAELNAVKGMDHHFTVTNPSTGEISTYFTDQHQDAIGAGRKGENFFSFVGADGVTRLVSPAYHGLSQACGNGVIDGPGFLC
jgi:hypothetical protein